VAASLSAPTLFVIANDLTKMQVNASLDEADIGNISSVEEVQFTVDAYPNRNYTGRISEVRLEPSTVQNVTTYSVIIDVENQRLELKPGMTANISITVARQDDVLKIPNAAMRYLPPGVTRDQITEMTRNGGSERLPAAGAMESERSVLIPSGSKEAVGREAPSLAKGAQSERTAARFGATGESLEGREPGTERNLGRPGPASESLQAELAPGQLWDPAEKIQFPQQPRWTTRPGVVWAIGAQRKPEPRQVLLGITDGTATQVVSGELQEGDEVIVGDSTQAAAAQMQQDRGPGGGGGFIFGGRR
jgi:HlyD family secretion protein